MFQSNSLLQRLSGQIFNMDEFLKSKANCRWQAYKVQVLAEMFVKHFLVGGWTNPFDTYYIVKLKNFPREVGVKIKHIWVATSQLLMGHI